MEGDLGGKDEPELTRLRREPDGTEWVTTAQAADLLGVSERRVRQLATALMARRNETTGRLEYPSGLVESRAETGALVRRVEALETRLGELYGQASNAKADRLALRKALEDVGAAIARLDERTEHTDRVVTQLLAKAEAMTRIVGTLPSSE